MTWNTRSNQWDAKMNLYQVHYEYVAKGMAWVQRGKRKIRARNEEEAILKCKSVVAKGWGHWATMIEPMALR